MRKFIVVGRLLGRGEERRREEKRRGGHRCYHQFVFCVPRFSEWECERKWTLGGGGGGAFFAETYLPDCRFEDENMA